MVQLGKNRKKAESVVDVSQKFTVEQAVALVKKAAYAKFDETVDVAVRLGVNPKHADQMVRGAIVLPHGTGQKLRVLVFARGEKSARRSARERTWQAPTSSSRRCKKGSWTSTASSPRPT